MWKIVDKVRKSSEIAIANCDNGNGNSMLFLKLRQFQFLENHTTTISFVASFEHKLHRKRPQIMPELPEVEYAAERLRRIALHKTLNNVESLHPAFQKRLPGASATRLHGRTLVDVRRRAKIQLLTFDDGQVLEVHFRMTGDWEFGDIGDPLPPYERLRLVFTDGTRVSLVDSRALAVVVRHDAGALLLPNIGPEPLTDALTPPVLAATLRPRRAPIKQLLLDQRVIAGIGNIYASEALWEARIHPTTPGNTLSLTRITRLIDAIRVVLQRAHGERYGTPEDVAFRVYDREGEPCTRHPHIRIRRLVQGARSTYYCARCQR